MLSRLRTAAIGILVVGGTVAPRAALAQAAATPASQPSAAKDTDTAAPAPTASETKKPARRRRRPVSESVEKAVDEVMQRHYDPCAAAAQKGVPCFPSRVDVVGPRFSVAEAMRKYRPDGRRAEGAPITASDMQRADGWRAALRERRGVGRPGLHGQVADPPHERHGQVLPLQPLGRAPAAAGAHRSQARPRRLRQQSTGALRVPREFSGECEAIAAWRKELREDVAPPPGESSDQGAARAPAPPPAEDEITIEERRPPPGTGPPPP